MLQMGVEYFPIPTCMAEFLFVNVTTMTHIRFLDVMITAGKYSSPIRRMWAFLGCDKFNMGITQPEKWGEFSRCFPL